MLCGVSWKPIFSAKPAALKAAAADARGTPRPPACVDAPPGRFLNVDARQTFSADGRTENSLRFLWGAVRLSFCGLYEMSGRRMSITFEALRIRLLFGLLRLSLDLREGTRLRAFVERRLRGTTSQQKKRPNIFNWCYADAGLCVAQGSSGSVAVWAATAAEDGAERARTDAEGSSSAGARVGLDEDLSGGCAKAQLARRATYRARPPTMVHSEEETAAALIFPLLGATGSGADGAAAAFDSFAATAGQAYKTFLAQPAIVFERSVAYMDPDTGAMTYPISGVDFSPSSIVLLLAFAATRGGGIFPDERPFNLVQMWVRARLKPFGIPFFDLAPEDERRQWQDAWYGQEPSESTPEAKREQEAEEQVEEPSPAVGDED